MGTMPHAEYTITVAGSHVAINPLRGPVSWAKNRLVQWGVTISDGIETPNSLHLDCKILVRLQEDCEVTISKS